MRALMGRLPRPSRADTEAKLAELQVPTLVVFGTQDAVVPAEMGRVYREKMPNCNYVLVYDAGHEVGAERPKHLSAWWATSSNAARRSSSTRRARC